MEGTIVNGYELKYLLGKGGMAEVWYAENGIGMPAAVKILYENMMQNEQVVERFHNEALVMVRLNHPNIRQVQGYGYIGNRHCIIMEYLEGEDLDEMMRQGRRFTDEELRRWWNQIVDALNYTHAQGIVHRDIKPSNIFIGKDGNVKLLDFGIAKMAENASLTQTGTVMGTLMYMSPEQVKSTKGVDYRTDLYSLAVTFVHLLSGRKPYDDTVSSAFDIQLSILSKPLDLDGIPTAWRNFLTPYLNKAADHRPALRYFENVAPPHVAPPQPSSPKKKVGLWIGIGAGALTMMIAFIVILVLLLKPSTTPNPSITQGNTTSGSSVDINRTEKPKEQVTTQPSVSTEPKSYAPNGAINGLFSVSSSKQVYFSKGNLQYQPSSNSWRFASNQWETMGNSNTKISSTYSGWIDLFCWGTGNAPYQSSVNNADYSSFSDWGWYYDRYDSWRTLTIDEWNYLFNSRANASSKHGGAYVNGVAGVVILPDQFVMPSGCYLSASNRYSANSYTSADWHRMEDAGAVFLPTAGRRTGLGLYNWHSDGDYWSSTSLRNDRAYNVDFSDSKIKVKDDSPRKHGFAVRLVKNK